MCLEYIEIWPGDTVTDTTARNIIKSLNVRLRKSSTEPVQGGQTLSEGLSIAYQAYQRISMRFQCSGIMPGLRIRGETIMDDDSKST